MRSGVGGLEFKEAAGFGELVDQVAEGAGVGPGDFGRGAEMVGEVDLELVEHLGGGGEAVAEAGNGGVLGGFHGAGLAGVAAGTVGGFEGALEVGDGGLVGGAGDGLAGLKEDGGHEAACDFVDGFGGFHRACDRSTDGGCVAESEGIPQIYFWGKFGCFRVLAQDLHAGCRSPADGRK